MTRQTLRWACQFAVLLFFAAWLNSAAAEPLVFEGTDGPGKGKHIVLVSGDEEYSSEEALPQLAKILAKHHGCRSHRIANTPALTASRKHGP